MTDPVKSSTALRPFALGIVLVSIIVGAGAVLYHMVVNRGPRITVHFDREGQLARGAEVVLGGRVVGEVEEVDTDGGKMTVHVRLLPDDGKPLPREITFLVSPGGKSEDNKLEAHVLDPNAEPLEDGDDVAGVGSKLELAVRLGAHAASDMMRQAREHLEAAREELEDIDWDKLGSDLGERSEKVKRELERLGGQAEREVERGIEKVEPMVQELIRDLEELGRSEDARRLKKRLDQLWDKHVRRDRARSQTRPNTDDPEVEQR